MHVADPDLVRSDIFMYLLRPTRPEMLLEGPTQAEMDLAADHWRHTVEQLKAGAVLFGGRTLVPTGDSFALVVIRANSEAAARDAMEADPAVQGGLFHAQLYPFQPLLMGSWEAEPGR